MYIETNGLVSIGTMEIVINSRVFLNRDFTAIV